MVTCRDVIMRAMRKARIIDAGEEPSIDEIRDGLSELQNLYEQWGANGMFGRLSDVLTNGDYDAAPNERVTLNDVGTVTIPTTVDDDGTDYPPFEMAYIEVINTVAATVTRSLYTNGAWVTISDLDLDDEAPLADKGNAGLAACLAMNLAEEFGGQVGAGVARQAGAFKTGLSLRYGVDAQRTAPEYF